MNRKCSLQCLALLSAIVFTPAALASDLGTAFTYQGQLKRNGMPLNGEDAADMRFTLYDASTAGNIIAGPVTIEGVDFVDGLFTIDTLSFGPDDDAFNGQGRWMLIEIRDTAPLGSPFVALDERQPVMPAPYALALPGLRVQQTGASPNVVGGQFENAIRETTVPIVGATIGGGGAGGANNNRVNDNYGTVAGGQNNQAGNTNNNSVDADYATVAGGQNNTASATVATVLGGGSNTASAQYSTTVGGRLNTAGGHYSLAAGRRAKVRTSVQTGDADGDEGTFVWADSADADFLSTGPNQFLIRAGGGVGIGQAPGAGEMLSVAGLIESSSGGFKFPDGSTQTTAAGTSLWSASGSNISNTNSGSVGIGTTNPQRRLHVAGNSNVLALEGSDHAYLEYYPDTFAGGRKAWMGFGGATNNNFELQNQIPGAHIVLSTSGGGVGIGTSTPSSALHVFGNQPAVRIQENDSAGSFTELIDADTASLQVNKHSSTTDSLIEINPLPALTNRAAKVRLFRSTNTMGAKTLNLYKGDGTGTISAQIGVDGSDSFLQLHGGNVGIGTGSPGATLDVVGDVQTDSDLRVGTRLTAEATTGDLNLRTPDGAEVVTIGSRDGVVDGGYALFKQPDGSSAVSIFANALFTGGGMVSIADNGGTPKVQAYVDINGDGIVSTSILEITGADVAEKFPVSDEVEPGMVVEIDPANPGHLRLSREAYNRRVAGVVSGGGGLPVGAILGNLPGNEDAPPIALSGRVWVHCDASNGPIQPGDLLTTSDTPGRAMKLEDYARGQGAIIGKAMTHLKAGERGLVLVLVNLQ